MTQSRASAERCFSGASFALPERAVRDEGRDVVSSKRGSELLGPRPAVDEDEPLLTAMEAGDHECGVVEAADVVECDRRDLGVLDRRAQDVRRPSTRRGQPGEEFVGVAQGGRERDALDLAAGEPAHSFENGEQMPASIVASEGVCLVDDDAPHVGEPALVIDAARDEHRLDRLGRGQQHVGRLGEKPVAFGLAGVPVPEADGAADEAAVAFESGVEVVEQRPKRAHVEDGQASPVLGEHPREQGEDRCLGLSAGGRCHRDGVITAEDRDDGLGLERPQRSPPEAVDDVVRDRGVELVEGFVGHGSTSRSMSSTLEAARALRSMSVSSPSVMVSL